MIDDYRKYVATDIFRTYAIIVRNEEFTADTPLYNPTVGGIPLVRNNEPLYIDGIKFYPFPFNFTPPEQNENSINEAQISITVLNTLVYAALKDLMSAIEVEVRYYKVMALDTSEVIEVYDQGNTIQAVQSYELMLLTSAFYVVNAYTLTQQTMDFALTYAFSGDIGVGTLSYTVDIVPNVFERVY